MGFILHGGVKRTQTFVLDVNFVDKTISANNGDGIPFNQDNGGSTSSYIFTFNSGWDNRGLFVGGTFKLKRTSNHPGYFAGLFGGVLTGLIGQDGAIGVFKSNRGTLDNFRITGGFVAIAPARRTLPRLFDNALVNGAALPILETNALVGENISVNTKSVRHIKIAKGGGRIDLTLIGIDRTNRLIPGTQSLTFGDETDYSPDNYSDDGVDLNGERSSGLAFAITGSAANSRKAYIGFLPDTDVGAALTANDFATPEQGADITATWKGRFFIANANSSDIAQFVANDFVLTVDFTNKALTSTITNIFNNSDSNFVLTGAFTDTGLITGTGQLVTGSESRVFSLNGLIGTKGAVAAFTPNSNVNGNNQIFGGFVATPDAVNIARDPGTFDRWAAVAKQCAKGTSTSAVYPDILDDECKVGRRPLTVLAADSAFTYPTRPANNASNADKLNYVQQNFGFIRAGATGIDIPDGDANSNDQGLRDVALIEATVRGASSSSLTLDAVFANSQGEVFDLGGDKADGVAYLGNFLSGVGTYYYTGLLSGTAVGDNPVSQDGAAKAHWPGRIALEFYSIKYISNDFELTVDFNSQTIENRQADGLADGVVSTVSLLPIGSRGSISLSLKGTYDEGGLITGVVRAGSAVDRIEGPLTGVIGAQGAVGAFYYYNSNLAGSPGGFVAAPVSKLPDRANAIHWAVNAKQANGTPLRSVKDEGVYAVLGRESAVASTSGFIRGTADGLNFGVGTAAESRVLDFADSYRMDDGRFIDFNGKSSDGIAFGFASFTTRQDDVRNHYAGLLSGTDVGATFEVMPADSSGNNITAEWNGVIRLANRSLHHQVGHFTLNVDFTTQTLTHDPYSISIGGNNWAFNLVNASFDNTGIVKGGFNLTIPAGLRNDGLISGLIGEKGAVVALYSASGALGPVVGGFVASPFAKIVSARGTGDYWLENSVMANGRDALMVKTAGTAVQGDSAYTLILGGAGTLELGAATKTALTHDLVIAAGLSLTNGNRLTFNADLTGGVSFAEAMVGGDTQYYAGLLSGTNVGAPMVDNTLSGTWTGALSIALTSPREGAPSGIFTKAFALAVDFDARTINSETLIATQTAGNGNITDYSVIIDAGFDMQGRIFGGADYQFNVSAGPDMDDTGKSTGLVSGLIGINGAVGVFASSATTDAGGFVGGFVAEPNDSNYYNWLASVGTDTPTAPSASDTGALFLQGLPTIDGLIAAGDIPANGAMDVANRTPYSLTLEEDTNDGVVYYALKPTGGASTVYYAGLLTTTDVGTPLVKPATDTGAEAIYTGKLGAVLGTDTMTITLESNVTFNLNLYAETFDATIASASNIAITIMDGGWNEKGLLSGTITATPEDDALAGVGLMGAQGAVSGMVRGVIGDAGAVGAFISDAGGAYNYSGGFVARPPAGN